MLPLTRALATTTLFLAAATFALAQGGGPTGGGGAGSGGGPGPGYALHVDLAYADRSAARNLLDVYVPDGVENPPVVVLIHGGGFMMGDKSAPDGLDMFLRAGLAVAAINYRLSDEAIWPAQLQDVTDAFAFVRANGDALGYDETRIASFGASAGGHLSAVAGITLAADPATALKASVVWFPPVLFTEMDADMAAIGLEPIMGVTAEASSAESRLIGAPVGQNPELALAASPLSLLEALPPEATLPPFLIMHGARDTNISRLQSGRLLMALMTRPGTESLEFRLLPASAHGSGEFRRLEAMAEVISFLQRHLAP